LTYSPSQHHRQTLHGHLQHGCSVLPEDNNKSQ
jgi:hypothetical protein